MPTFCETYDKNRTPAVDVDMESLETLGLTIFKSNKYCFESVAFDIVNFFADIDVKCSVSDPDSVKWFEGIRQRAAEAFLESGFFWTDGSYIEGDKSKLSFHIFDRRIQIYKTSFSWNSDYGKAMKDVVFENFRSKDRSVLEPGLDDAVYGKKPWLRTPFSTTLEKPHPHVPGRPGRVADYLVTSLPENGMNIDPRMRAESQKKSKAAVWLSIPVDEETEEDSDPERAGKMLSMLAKVKTARFKEYAEWIKLLSLCRGNEIPLAKFLQMSKESGYASYDEEECTAAFYRMEKSSRKCGFPTIHKWLEADGVDWKKLFSKEKDKMIKELLDVYRTIGTLPDLQVADIFHRAYGDSLYLTPYGWLHYSHKGWEIDNEESIVYPLMKCIGSKLVEYADSLDKEDEIRKPLMKQASHLCSYSACRGIIKTAASLFRNDNILDEFDRYPTWFAFSDHKAVDLMTGEIIEIKKEHKILATCGYPLPDRSEKEIAEAREVVHSITGGDEMMSSMLSYNLQSGNPQQLFFVQTGSGGNGKSIVGNLMRGALGKYAGVLPIEQITMNATGRDTANSALFAMRGKRYAQLNEPEDDAGQLTLKVARLKELSGESTVPVRELHGKSTQMRVDFSMNILCNEIPRLSKVDGDNAVGRRLKIVKFPYQFVEEPTEPHHRLRDEEVKSRSESSPSLRRGFFWFLADMFKKTKGRFIVSEAVRQSNREYLDSNSPLSEWAGDYHIAESFIRQKDLFADYTEWSTMNRNDKREKLTARKFGDLIKALGWKIEADASNGNKVYVSKF